MSKPLIIGSMVFLFVLFIAFGMEITGHAVVSPDAAKMNLLFELTIGIGVMIIITALELWYILRQE